MFMVFDSVQWSWRNINDEFRHVKRFPLSLFAWLLGDIKLKRLGGLRRTTAWEAWLRAERSRACIIGAHTMTRTCTLLAVCGVGRASGVEKFLGCVVNRRLPHRWTARLVLGVRRTAAGRPVDGRAIRSERCPRTSRTYQRPVKRGPATRFTPSPLPPPPTPARRRGAPPASLSINITRNIWWVWATSREKREGNIFIWVTRTEWPGRDAPRVRL